MLILTRRIGEGVTIGDNVRVVILEVRGKQIRLGVDAPTDVLVLRDEILQRLTQENLQAADFTLNDLKGFFNSVNGHIEGYFYPPETRSSEPSLAIDSSILGAIQVPEDQIITFDQGLFGMDDGRQYLLLGRAAPSPYYLLQGVDQPGKALLLAESSGLVKDFKLGRLNSTLEGLKANGLEELQVFVPLTIPSGRPRETTANLVSPILINPHTRLGKQVVLENQHYSHRHRILSDV